MIGTEDNEIVGLFYMRNEKAIEETGGKYGGLMKKISRNILKDPRDAEECYNDSLCAVWNAIPPAKPDSAGKTRFPGGVPVQAHAEYGFEKGRFSETEKEMRGGDPFIRTRNRSFG